MAGDCPTRILPCTLYLYYDYTPGYLHCFHEVMCALPCCARSFAVPADVVARVLCAHLMRAPQCVPLCLMAAFTILSDDDRYRQVASIASLQCVVYPNKPSQC